MEAVWAQANARVCFCVLWEGSSLAHFRRQTSATLQCAYADKPEVQSSLNATCSDNVAQSAATTIWSWLRARASTPSCHWAVNLNSGYSGRGPRDSEDVWRCRDCW
eukprot:8749877-Pyramimonas_sp.AAC.1